MAPVLHAIGQALQTPERWAWVAPRIVWLGVLLIGGPCLLGVGAYALLSPAPRSVWLWSLLPLTLMAIWTLRHLMWQRTRDEQLAPAARLFAAAFLGGVMIAFPLALFALTIKVAWLPLCLLLCASLAWWLTLPLADWAAQLAALTHKQKAQSLPQ